jgi:hypothetical protein
MIQRLTDELRAALRQSDGPLEVRDEQTQKLYVIADREMFQRAMGALKSQEDRQSIESGLIAMQAGRVMTLEELDARILSKLGG